jgi:hypothetical protein
MVQEAEHLPNMHKAQGSILRGREREEGREGGRDRGKEGRGREREREKERKTEGRKQGRGKEGGKEKDQARLYILVIHGRLRQEDHKSRLHSKILSQLKIK